MELAVAALGSLLPKLGKLLTDEYKLQKGVRGEIKFLKAEMESMQAALHTISRLPAHQIDDLRKIWVRDLKELSYDIEDSVESFMLRVDAPGSAEPKSFKRFFGRTVGLLRKAMARHHTADDIQDIKSRIQEVAGRHERYKIPEVAVQPESTEMDPRIPALYEDVKNLVGIEGPAEKLTALLMHGEGAEKQQLMVVSIVGVGGLGKTTLANSVYQRIRGEFQSKAFVSVSLKPDIKKIFSSILRQVSGGEYPNAEAWSHTELIDTIRQILEKKRYIIVIDDVWGESAWTQIKCALTENSLGSRVIVTTRNSDVAKFSCSSIDGTMCELDPLSYEDSKKLLCKRVLNENEEMHSELEEVSRKILEKCGGIPLAIITTASLLASRPNKSKYEWYSVYSSMGSGLHKDKSLDNMRAILYLSYSDLPSHLKPCLLYLSMFPEDYDIRSDNLVQLWIAEGFIIDEKQGSNLYDLGERYFNELVNRSMIQPIYENGNPKACRVHDMVLDLIISLSAQENFVTILEGTCHISTECKIRRLSLRGSKSDSKEEQMIFSATVNISHVRSVIAFGDAVQWMPPLSKFPVLRVLAFRMESRNNIRPEDLGSLQHLRYLELGGEFETELLEGIGNLKLLKTLHLWGQFEGELPASISQLQQLENLSTGSKRVKFPDGTGNLISLHELSWLCVSESPNTLAELGNLTKLRVLKISGLLYKNMSYVKTFQQALSKLVNLRRLVLFGGGTCSLDYMPDQWTGPAHLQSFDGDDITFSQVPRWFSFLSELSSLSMWVNLLRQEDLKLLGALPVLRFLELKVGCNGTITEEQLVIDADHPFRSLAEFTFKHYKRCWLEFARGVMPKLQRLELYFKVRRREGVSFDIGLENLASLKHVTVQVDCVGAWMSEVKDVEDKVRAAVKMHPNNPTLQLSRQLEDVMGLAVAALGSLLPKLATLLTDEYKLQKGIRGEIRFLKAEMESMQAALDRVSKLPPQQIDALHSIWVRDLKELSYDIEDSVDSIMLRVDAPGCAKPKSFRRFFDRTFGLLTKAMAWHHIADDILDIKSHIQEVAGRRERYGLPEVAAQSENTEIDPCLLAAYEDASFVGIEGPTQKVINLLNMGGGVQKEKLRVVSIVGVGGLGKTTIANSVYERLGGQFQCQAFVSVSLKPNLKQILSSILRQISEGKCTNAGEKDLDELIESIRKFLVDKRYLIVIDDVWDNKAWIIIKCALIDKTVGSRVIVTTRNIDVANFCSLDGEVFELEPLSDEDSKMLLCKRVFNKEDGIYSELEEVTNKILVKCGGIPLAIITTASLLASRPNKSKYEWYSVYSSMGSGLHKDKSLDNMRAIHYLSYSDLPSYLKPCLLYLSMFPEDYEIPSDGLVRLWIAEGFVDEKQGSNLYDLGERYFNELANRSMIQPIYENGSPTYCRVHFMILDLIISLSAQENFVTILEGPCHISSASKIRRLSLRGSKSNSKKEQMIFPEIVNLSNVRSVIAFGDAVQWMPPMSMFPVLRVLALKTDSRNNIHPKDLGSLQHLRYLELGGYIETELLEGIGNLKLLKTLDLSAIYIRELPASISQLQQLENLLTGSDWVKFPDGTGNLISLHELSWLCVNKSPNTFAELGNLTKLRVLKISGLLYKNMSYVKTFQQALSKLVNLRRLVFFGDGTCSLDYMPDKWTGPAHLQSFDGDDITFSQVPRWFSFLSELSSLSMWVNLLRQEDLKLLGALPVLRFLRLKVDLNGTITEEQLVIGADHLFRSLAEFTFKHNTRCRLEFARGVMPKLQRLELYFEVRRREGVGFDIGLENLASLKHVAVKVDCEGARTKEVEDVEYKVRDAVDMHPNHPTLQLSRCIENEMIKDENKDGHEVPEES